jgi:ankyrin repeat protein
MSKTSIVIFFALLALIATACGPVVNDTISGEQQETSEQTMDDVEVNMDLIAAAARGDVETVTDLLAQGADVHTSNTSGVTPLIAASYQNHIKVAKVLIDAGADVNVQDDTQQSAYLISTSDGFLELLQLTLAAGADVHSLDSYNGTGLIRAADRGHVEIIEELLETDIEIDHVNRLGWTALLEAIILGDGGPRHTEVVRLLVEAAADINLADSNGVTPLEHVRQRGFDEMATILIPAPAAPTTTQAAVTTPATPTTTQTAVPGPTLHPLASYTIPELRKQSFSGGPIQVRSALEQNEAFSRYYIDYPSDGLTITGVMHVPTGTGPFPVLILLHGYVDRDQYYAGADTWQAAEFFARHGYLVLAPDLRSWGESDSGLSLFHMGLVVDVLNLISSLPSVPAADPSRVGLWGHSMGGGIATKVLTIDDRVQTAVLYAPNSADDADLIARWGPGCLEGQSEAVGDRCNPAEIIPPDTPPALIEAYLDAAADEGFLQQVAPLYHVANITAPVQIHVGTADGAFLTETPPEWSDKLATALQAAGRDIAYFTYAGQGHFFTGESWDTLLDRAWALCDTQLKTTS